MQTIAIVGLGLIGGCLGLDLMARGYEVVGVARRPATCEQALARGVVHQAGTELSLIKPADVVFVCTPIGVVVHTIAALAAHLKSSAVVTDVASVKGSIVMQATALCPNFVGGHPMAGKAEAGLGVAETGLFADRPYVLTPIEATSPEALQQVRTLVGQLHGRLYECQPHEHDRAVAWISHLPVMISSCLIQACQTEPDPAILGLAQALASSGFRDTSRVGGGDPQLGTMMARYNRHVLLQCLESYQARLNELVDCIRHDDWDNLAKRLAETQAERKPYVSDPAAGPGAEEG
jgi:arogenate dehydrogenase (NADP+)